MIAVNEIQGKRIGESIYAVGPATITDATDYLQVPIGYSPSLSVTGTAVLSVTDKVATDPATIQAGDWTTIAPTENPFGIQVQVTWIKIVTTGAVVIRGFIR